jgi:hypothetical protein
MLHCLLLLLLQGWLWHKWLLLLLLQQRLLASSCWRCGLCDVETHLPVYKVDAGYTNTFNASANLFCCLGLQLNRTSASQHT